MRGEGRPAEVHLAVVGLARQAHLRRMGRGADREAALEGGGVIGVDRLKVTLAVGLPGHAHLREGGGRAAWRHREGREGGRERGEERPKFTLAVVGAFTAPFSLPSPLSRLEVHAHAPPHPPAQLEHFNCPHMTPPSSLLSP